MLQTLRILAIILVMVPVGCAKYELPSSASPYLAIQPLDADKNRVIDDEDVQELEAEANSCYQTRVLPYFSMADIEVETEKDLWSEQNTMILKETLTVAEWERLTEGMKEWNKLRTQLEVTKAAADSSEPTITDSGVVRGIAYHPKRLVPHLEDGRLILLTGIGVPTHASRYRKMANDMFSKLAKKKIIRIEYDVARTVSGGSYLQGYIYTDECFVNAEMVAKGYAKAMPLPPNNKYDDEFKRLEKEAKAAKLGIWAFTDEF